MSRVKEQSARGAALLPGEERRRSQRVIIRVPLTLEMTFEGGQTKKIAAYTVAVNIHGAMVVSPHLLDPETVVNVISDRTGDRISARITRAPRDSAEGYLTPIEFTTASPDFWHINFPPENWKVPEN